MNTIILIIVIMGAIGIFFGFILAYANKKLAVEMNPLIHVVEDILPKGQCGACGFPGCMAYAEAVVLDKDVSPSLCVPGKKAVAEKVAQITGKKAEEVEPRIASVKCASFMDTAKLKYKYAGVEDCVAATLIQGGPKECPFGCIGLGTCEKECPFDAIKVNEQGMPVVDKTRCTGCGKCVAACPKKVIELLPLDAHVVVRCNSLDKGAVKRKYCPVACIGCGLCVKSCPYGAVKLENNLAVVDSSICKEKCTESVCLAKCPTGAIKDFII